MDYLKEYVVKELVKLVNIPSPSGFTSMAVGRLKEELEELGYRPWLTKKGACVVEIGGEGSPIVLTGHLDTLGAMVRSLKSNGRIEITPIGGFMMNSVEGENCIVHTKTGKNYTGTIQTIAPSVHVFENARKLDRTVKNMEIRLDEIVNNREDLTALEIEAGDFVSFDVRCTVTPNGFIKSRHLDDKASVAIMLDIARRVANKEFELKRKVYMFFSTYEEVGHGASSGIPEEVEEILSVDMGSVGDTLTTDEYVVSICAKDSTGPYNAEVVKALIEAAKLAGADYRVDIYPFYGSDADASMRAGYDAKHGLIGPGVEASHGYERTHYKGLENTVKLIREYLKK